MSLVSVRTRALLVPAVVLALAACSAAPSAQVESSTSSTAASSASGSPASGSSSSSDTAGPDSVQVELVALPVAQSLLGFAAQASRDRRGLDPADPDARLFSALRKSKKDWLVAAPLLAQEAQLRQVSVLVEGVDPLSVSARDIQVKDGIEITVLAGSQECVVVANFVETATKDTVMSWSEPVCSDVS